MQQSEVLGLSPAGFHRVTYYAFGNPEGRLTFCVHGLTRNGRDFDRLAETLAAQGRYVICPDIVGRGQSDWLPRPELYGYPQYLADMAVLMAKMGDRPVDWVGTSMGGLIGMMLAAQPKSPIRSLVLNDIGAFIPAQSLQRLADYVGKSNNFASLFDVETYLRKVHAPFGAMDDAAWQHLALHSARQGADGCYTLAYDPQIGVAFSTAMVDVNLWPVYGLVRCPVLILRGKESDLLPAEVAQQMMAVGVKAKVIEIEGCGHAPSLMTVPQISIIADFLESVL